MNGPFGNTIVCSPDARESIKIVSSKYLLMARKSKAHGYDKQHVQTALPGSTRSCGSVISRKHDRKGAGIVEQYNFHIYFFGASCRVPVEHVVVVGISGDRCRDAAYDAVCAHAGDGVGYLEEHSFVVYRRFAVPLGIMRWLIGAFPSSEDVGSLSLLVTVISVAAAVVMYQVVRNSPLHLVSAGPPWAHPATGTVDDMKKSAGQPVIRFDDVYMAPRGRETRLPGSAYRRSLA